MSKYNLSDILNEYIGGGRIGTLKISFKDLQDKMDELEDSGKVIVRTLSGPSGDGKVNREFEVVDRDSAVPGGNKQERGFTVYDYKFGFDPGSEDKFMNEYPFSVGGNDLKLAMELIDGVEEYKFEESMNEENVIKDLAQADEVIKMIKMMNPDVRADLLMRIARMGQKMDENRREKNPEGMGQLYVQPAVQREVKFHLDAYDKGDIDVDDMIQAIEDIIFGYVKAPGQRNEVMGIDRKGNKKDDTKDTMLAKARATMKESSQEESLANYLIKSYTDPKTGKSMVDDRMISDFMKTVPEWEDMFDGSEEGNDSIDKEFEEFLFLNYDSIDEVKGKKEMKQLKEHFNRFK